MPNTVRGRRRRRAISKSERSVASSIDAAIARDPRPGRAGHRVTETVSACRDQRCSDDRLVVPSAGVEPATFRSRGGCSTC
jgi:hypothetical protein